MAGGASVSKIGDLPPLQPPKALSQQLFVGSNQISIPISSEKIRSGSCKEDDIGSKNRKPGGSYGMAGRFFKFKDSDFPPLSVSNKIDSKVQSFPIPDLIDRTQNKTTSFPSAQEKSNLDSVSSDLVKSKSKLANAYEGRFDYKPLHLIDGKPCVSFKVSDKLGLLSKIKHIVIAKFSHLRPKYQDFQNFLFSMKFKAGFKISIFDNKHLFVEFECFEDFVKLWMLKSCVIYGYRVRFFKWEGDFHPTIESSIAPIWVHLPRLPLYLFDEEAIISIASVFGNPIYINPDNLAHDKIGELSFCVARDVREKGPDILWIEFVGDGIKVERFRQEVLYGAIPDFCSNCKHMGHSVSDCKVVVSYLLKGMAFEENEKRERLCSQETLAPVSNLFHRLIEGDNLMLREDKGKQTGDDKDVPCVDEEGFLHASELGVMVNDCVEEGEINNAGKWSNHEVRPNSEGKGSKGKYQETSSCTLRCSLPENLGSGEIGIEESAMNGAQVDGSAHVARAETLSSASANKPVYALQKQITPEINLDLPSLKDERINKGSSILSSQLGQLSADTTHSGKGEEHLGGTEPTKKVVIKHPITHEVIILGDSITSSSTKMDTTLGKNARKKLKQKLKKSSNKEKEAQTLTETTQQVSLVSLQASGGNSDTMADCITATKDMDCKSDDACMLRKIPEPPDFNEIADDAHVLSKEETARLILEKLQFPKKYADQISLHLKVPQLVTLCEKKFIRNNTFVEELVDWIIQNISWKNSIPPKEYQDYLESLTKPAKNQEVQKSQKDQKDFSEPPSTKKNKKLKNAFASD